MKSLRRWVALALCLAMCCALLPQMSLLAHAETSGSCGADGDNLTWTLDGGVLTITGSGAMQDYDAFDEDNRAPWYDSRESITAVALPSGLLSIGAAAFYDCPNLRSVDVPESVELIARFSFCSCSSLTSIELPAELLFLDEYAFSGCISLTAVALPAKLVELGHSAFADCTGLQTVSFPDGLRGIDGEVFSGCTGLTAVTLPAELGSVAQGMFRGCTGLTQVTFPASLSLIGKEAFAGCVGLTGVSFPETLMVIRDSAFEGCTGLSEVSFPASLEELDSKAFFGCTGLQSVTIREGLEELGQQAFSGCTGLTVINLPASLKTIERSILSGCTALTAINVAAGNTNYCSDNGVLYDSAKTVLIQYPAAKTDSSYVIPASVTQIGNEACFGSAALTSVTLPEGLQSVGWLAFFGCPSMSSVTIPASVTAIQGMAFGYYGSEESDAAKVEGFTIYGAAKSEAQTYAKMNGFRFVFENPFDDVLESDYFYNAVMWALDLEITAGVDATHFGPHQDCTREQIVTFLWKSQGSPKTEEQNNSFTDVKPGQYYYKAVIWALENKITAGIGNQLFGVGYSCTREQAVTFLWKAVGASEPQTTGNQFSDVDPSAYYYKPVLWAAENGITAGIGGGMFGVGQTCTRAQIITFLYKTFGAEN